MTHTVSLKGHKKVRRLFWGAVSRGCLSADTLAAGWWCMYKYQYEHVPVIPTLRVHTGPTLSSFCSSTHAHTNTNTHTHLEWVRGRRGARGWKWGQTSPRVFDCQGSKCAARQQTCTPHIKSHQNVLSRRSNNSAVVLMLIWLTEC